jgi:hypothetical protein
LNPRPLGYQDREADGVVEENLVSSGLGDVKSRTQLANRVRG